MDFEVNSLEKVKKDIKVNIILIEETIQHLKGKIDKDDEELYHWILNYIQFVNVQLDETRNKLNPIMKLLEEFNGINNKLLKCKQDHNKLVLKLEEKLKK